MRKKQSMSCVRIFAFLLFTVLVNPGLLLSQLHKQLKWDQLPPLPVSGEVSGMFAGVSQGALICLGGAQTISVAATETNTKQFHDEIYILEAANTQWKLAAEKLPYPVAFGVSLSYKDKIILVGGTDGNFNYSTAKTVTYTNGKITWDSLPSLPLPLANMSGALVGDILFIAGGNSSPKSESEKIFLALNMAEDPADRQWMKFESWPGPGRTFSVSASMQNKYFLFSGIQQQQQPSGEEVISVLKDAYSFTPQLIGKKLVGGTWLKLADMPKGVAKGASPAPTMGLEHILFPGGVDEITNSLIDSLALLVSVSKLQAYHIGTNSWVDFGTIPIGQTRISPAVVKWDQQWVIAGGESGTEKATSGVFALLKKIHFGWINWAALIAYLGLMIWIGFLFDKKREQTTKNFFTASGRIPWWAAGVSIFGTQLSAITFMATPALVFATDWSLAIGTIMIVFTVPIVVKYYIPFFRRLSVTSAYEYLEYRFSPVVRILGSISFILFQLGRMGVVLYLPAIAIASVTGINIFLIIFIMGIVCTLYTVMGGIEAVIWTDVIQVFILMGGAILCLVLAIVHVEGGISGIFTKGMEAGKFALMQEGWDASKQVVWVIVVGFFFLNIIPYTSDQTVVQRYLTVKDEKAAAKSLWANALLALPTLPIFFGLGTALFVFYGTNVKAIPSEQVGEILPYFVVQQIPVGIAGIVIAGIFAASQSTLSASMNSISAAYLSDIHPRLRKLSNDRDNLRLAKLITIAVGVFGIASAIAVVLLNATFVFELFMEILGIMGGALAGIFFLGIFTKKANASGVIVGLICGVIAVWGAKIYTDTNVYLYGAISVVTTFCTGLLASLWMPGKKQVSGLTYFTIEKEETTKTD